MKGIISFVILVLLAYGIHYYRERLPLITGYGAKYMCSSVFLAGHNEQQVREEDLGQFPFNYATYIVNYTELSVTSSVFGFAQHKAIYRNGLIGATLINELTEEQVRAQIFKIATPPDVNQEDIPWPMGNKIEDNNIPSNINQKQLQEAIDNLFIERDAKKLKRTRAIVVVYDGKLIAEQYGPGFSRLSRVFRLEYDQKYNKCIRLVF